MTTYLEPARARPSRAAALPTRPEPRTRTERQHRRPPAVFATDLPFGGQWRVLIHL